MPYMNRESVARVLLLIAVGLPGLCVTWLLTQLIDQSLDNAADLRARITKIEARQIVDARAIKTIQIAQRSNESSMEFVKNMLTLHMQSTMKDDTRNLPIFLDIQSAVQDVKRDTEAMRAKIDPPQKPFESEIGRP